MINRYSLADYSLTLKCADSASQNIASIIGEGISIGGPGTNGEGSFLGQISIRRNEDLWKTQGDATGSWVHEQNLNKTGTIELQIRQISDNVIKFCQICSAYESIQDSESGLTIQINSSIETSPIIAKCTDCYITKIADQNFSDASEMQTWTFTCGRIDFYPSN